MSIISLETQPYGHAARMIWWREQDDGQRDAMYIITVQEGHSFVLSSPDGSLERMQREVAYEYETQGESSG